jgi:signal transduction histidine kinase
MRFIFTFISLFWFAQWGHTQKRSFTTFQDYFILSANLDSLKKVERNALPNPHSSDYLKLQIAIQFGGQNQTYDINVEKVKSLIPLATKLKSQVGLAMTYFILGRFYSEEREDSLAYDYLVKAEKIFTKNKDTTGMLYCYRLFRTTATVWANYPNMAKRYFNKLITVSTKSKNPIDKFLYYVSVLGADSFWEKQPTESQLSDAFNKAIELIDKYPYLEPMRRFTYHNYYQGYAFLNKHDKALAVALQTIQHPKIKAHNRDYQILGRAYIRVKKFDDAIVALERANEEIKKYNPTDLRRQRNINKLLKTAYINVGNLKAGIKAYDEYDRLNEIINSNNRMLAMLHFKQKYSFAKKEAYLRQLSLEKQVAEGKNKLLDAEKREATLKNLALENQAAQSKAQLLQTQIDIRNKESAIQLAESQKKLLFGGLLMALGLIGTILVFATKLRKTNAQLLALQQSRDKLYTAIAHDLRSPINNLNDLGALLQHLIKEGQMSEVDKVLGQIEQMRHKTHLLINNLLEWGKSQYFSLGGREVPQKTDVVPLVQDLYQTYLPFAEVKKVALLTQLPASQWLHIAPKDFMLAVRNLLDNALKNTSSGGTISVNIAHLPSTHNPQTQKIALRVTDTGKGIAADQLHYLQQVFAGKIKPDVGLQGLGLGMVLVYDFVQKNKALVSVESQVGKGTCFTLAWKVS